MRRQKSLRIGVHHADAVVWEPVYRTHLSDGVSGKAPTSASRNQSKLYGFLRSTHSAECIASGWRTRRSCARRPCPAARSRTRSGAAAEDASEDASDAATASGSFYAR